MRKYSHSHEWAQDLLDYLNKQSYTYKPYIVSTKKELREELKIPERSLDKSIETAEERKQDLLSHSFRPQWRNHVSVGLWFDAITHPSEEGSPRGVF